MKRILLTFFIILCGVNSLNAKDNNDTLKSTTKEVTVTATRVPEMIFEVPMATSVVDKAKLTDSKGIGFDNALNNVPGVLSQSRYGMQDMRITIRGYGARGAGDRSNAGTSRGIKIMINGIPETEPDGRTSMDNIDLMLADKIEIIRSNASALWGNAAGGVINILTNPMIEKPYLRVGGIFGSYGFQKYSVQSGTNFKNGNLYSTFNYTKFDGYRANSNAEKFMAFIGSNSFLSDKTTLSTFLSISKNKFFIPGPLTQAQYDATPEMANANYLAHKEMRDNNIAKFGLNFEHKFNENNSIYATGFLNPKYLERSERNTFREFTRYHIGGSLSYNNNFKITDDISNNFLAGIDNQYQNGAILFYFLNPNATKGNLKTDKKEGANSTGIFAQNEINLFEKFTLLVGVRNDIVTYSSVTDFDNGAPTDTSLRSQSKSFSKITPKIGLSYRLQPNFSVYFNLGGGVEVPAGNETDPPKDYAGKYLINPLLEPIISTSYEIGLKHSIEYNTKIINYLKYDIALFNIDITNDIIPYEGGKYYTTAGKSNRKGLELGISLKMFDELELNTAFTYMASKYENYKIDSALINSSSKGIADYSNNKSAGLPEYFYNVSLKYSPWFLYKLLYVELSNQGVGSYFVDDANLNKIESYSILNLQFGQEGILEFNGISIKPFFAINNLLDTKYAASGFINPDYDKTLKSFVFLEPGLPRNFVFGINVGL